MNQRTATTTLLLGLLCGCATPHIAPIGKGEPVALVVVMSPQADGVVKIHNQALGGGTAAGAASGTVVGGLWGLVCGPFMVLCIPVGALAGAVTGTAAGAVVGLTGALPEEKASLLRERLGRWQQSHDLLQELRRNVSDRARRKWNLDSDPSRYQVTVELQDLELTSTRDEQISFVARVRVSVRANGAPQPSTPTEKVYEYTGPFSSLAVWLDERNDFLDTSLSSFSQQVAAQIVSELARD